MSARFTLPAGSDEERDAGGCDQTVRLLRARRERPHRRAAEKRYELAAFHVPPLPWQLAQQLLRNAYDVVFAVIKAR